MPKNKSRSDARQDRRTVAARRRNDQPLIRFVEQQDLRLEPVRAMKATVEPKTKNQGLYDVAMASKDVIFGLGPAGTGKTWFAIQRAAEALKRKEIEKIYLTRPNVEVGRGFGFLPGDQDEKFSPYLLPVLEALNEAFGASHVENLLKNKVIDPRPLAFMRGSTLKNGWVIADEMQNATREEFKMLLTRFGENCKMIINGDPSQTDGKVVSGLIDATARLGSHRSISVVSFTKADTVRHGLVQDVIEAYED